MYNSFLNSFLRIFYSSFPWKSWAPEQLVTYGLLPVSVIPVSINLYRLNDVYMSQAATRVGRKSYIYYAGHVHCLGVLTVWPWVWNQNKRTQVYVRGLFVSSEEWNRLSWYWFRYYLHLDMTVYDLVSQMEPSFVLRTEEEICVGACRSVLPELPRKCDVLKHWFSVANYQLGSQCRIV
jgi:hypothetical protein